MTLVERSAARAIGTVESVAPNDITVLLDTEAPQAVALNAGEPQRFPRITGYILVPNEVGALVGVVSWLGVERSPFPKRTGLKDFGLVDLPFPLRKMSLVPLGTLITNRSESGVAYELRRGVLSFPSVGDTALLPTPEELRALIEGADADQRVTIGTSPLGADAQVSVDPDKLFGRHLAILGNTGSGKSCSVAGLIRWSLEAAERTRGAPPNARFLVLDPNGEYRETFEDLGDVRLFQVSPPEGAVTEPLRVPAWMWNSNEWSAFAQAAPATQRPLLQHGLRNLRAGTDPGAPEPIRLARFVRAYRSILRGKRQQGATAYTGFPANKNFGELITRFGEGAATYVDNAGDAREALEALLESLREVHAARSWTTQTGSGFNEFGEPDLDKILTAVDAVVEALPAVSDSGRASEDAPVPFDPSELPEHLEVLATEGELAQSASFVATLLFRIRSMLRDERLAPIVAPEGELTLEQWLTDYVGATDAANGRITVLDLSMVPADVLHTVIAVVARVVFEGLQRYRKLSGSELPTALVLEEAHSFVQRHVGEEANLATPARMCRETFERIAREGRKFGLGLVLSSQRPSELSPTVLAQCNTFLLHRIVNDRDQDLVGRLVPDNLGGLLRELPSLPSQQAILLGWAAQVPVLLRIRDLPESQRPRSADPAFWDVWTGAESREIDWGAVAKDWAGD